MNGAESLVRTLLKGGVDVCFANPGTSEMHFVGALDRVEGMRCVLGLFEGVCSGAADGYYRMTDTPASTLLHLGPGLANSAANLHNAKKAGSGIVNIVGEHALYHIQYDTPLTADIEGIARPFSHWVKTSPTSKTVAADGALAIQAARVAPGQIATLILPADTAWGEADGVADTPDTPPPAGPQKEVVVAAAKALKQGNSAMLFLGGRALRARGLELAGKIAAKTGCRIQAAGGTARIERGAGRVATLRLHFVVETAQVQLKGVTKMVLVGAKPPAAFFAYPGKPSVLTPPDCETTLLCPVDGDPIAALEALAAELGALNEKPVGVAQAGRPERPTGQFTLEGLGQALGATLPEGAIVVDESVTTGRGFFPYTVGAPPHDWLNNMGGSIGFGTPVAVGAAVACPNRKVIAMIGDGSAMYTFQSLWTMAREGLDICVMIFSNRSYNILYSQLADVGAANPGPRAIDMLTLDRPTIDFPGMAKSLGVPGTQVHDLEALTKQLSYAMSQRGPYLIDVVM
ncbi:MAG: thiamine pyrophosphate enzyme-like TPP-binding [Betaproteobacteria bacterium]|nr:thiamine pyrophosphate enzyme-like TPP-binding [Betaproteobacteria bacterium]